jgi:hypothetical protein
MSFELFRYFGRYFICGPKSVRDGIVEKVSDLKNFDA